MAKITVLKIVCGHCEKILQDVPDVFKKDPRVEVEVVYQLCPEVSYADGVKVLQRLRQVKEKRAAIADLTSQLRKVLERKMMKGGGDA